MRNLLKSVKDYMEFWGWTDDGGGTPVKYDDEGRIVAHQGDAQWVADVERACDTIKRLAEAVGARDGVD